MTQQHKSKSLLTEIFNDTAAEKNVNTFSSVVVTV